MIQIRDILMLILLSLFFTGVIYGIEKIFFKPHLEEESFIEPSLPEDFLEISIPEDVHIHEHTDTSSGTTTSSGALSSLSPEVLKELREKAREKKLRDAFLFSYIPQNFFPDAASYQGYAEGLLTSDALKSKVRNLSVEMYRDIIDVRGRMKQKTIKMYGVTDLPEAEFLAVFTHEFAHYLDIYYFSQSGFGGDTSRHFYDISWESTTILSSGQKKSDFVSGYAMTNKYEDFAESLTYYIFHNNDFSLKAEKSEKLRDKYDFFGKYLFFEGQFIGTDFSPENEVKDYYWDITKISTNINKFLQYVENKI